MKKAPRGEPSSCLRRLCDRWTVGASRAAATDPSFICLSCAVARRLSKAMSTFRIPIRAEQAIDLGHAFVSDGSLIAVRCQEEQRHGARAGMRSDDGVDVVDADVFDAETFADLLLEPFRIIDAIAMGDEDRLLGDRRRAGALHVVEQCGQRLLASAHLFQGDKVPPRRLRA